MDTALKTTKLTKQFGGVKAVTSLSISFRTGVVTGVIGPNGSGKTTLINTLMGMLPIDGGTVRVHGAELARLKPYDIPAYGMTRTFQAVRLFEQMSVLDNVLVVLTERGVGSALFERHTEYHESQARELLERVGLWEKRDELAENLSYGQRKLLEITRAIAMDAALYFFDEPFAGLFPQMRKVVLERMEALKRAGKTLILVEHDMALIRELTDHVIVLDAGALLAEGAPDEVLRDKKVIEAYLGE